MRIAGLTDQDLEELDGVLLDPEPQDFEGIVYSCKKLLDHVKGRTSFDEMLATKHAAEREQRDAHFEFWGRFVKCSACGARIAPHAEGCSRCGSLEQHFAGYKPPPDGARQGVVMRLSARGHIEDHEDVECNGVDVLCGLCLRRRCVIVMENDAHGRPDGFVEIQRDDTPDIPERYEHPFETDGDAARWLSARAAEVAGLWYVPTVDAVNVLGEEAVFGAQDNGDA